MPYFYISYGLRGCYMPDNIAVIKCDTRRELRNAIAYEAHDIRDAGFIGANERAISRLAAWCWRNRRGWQYDAVLPLAPSHARGSYNHGIFVSHATRADYLEYMESDT